MEGREEPFPAEGSHDAQHHDEAEGNPGAGEEATANHPGGTLAQREAAEERDQHKYGDGHRGD